MNVFLSLEKAALFLCVFLKVQLVIHVGTPLPVLLHSIHIAGK